MNNGIEVNRVKTDFMAKYSGREVKEIYKFDGGYFVVAPHSGVEEDFSDPFFVMSEDGKTIMPFVPVQDFDLYEKMTRNQIFGD